MFWIGMVVGIMIAVMGLIGLYLWVTRAFFKSPDEYWGAVELLWDASENRESTLQVWHDGELLNSIEFEDKE